MKGSRITRAEIEALDQECGVASDASPRLDPHKLQLFARCNPDQICYPVARGGGRNGVPGILFRRDK